MADPSSNSLMDDLGIEANPKVTSAADNPLMSDLGIQPRTTDWSGSDQAGADGKDVSKTPVGDEIYKAFGEIFHDIPRDVVEGSLGVGQGQSYKTAPGSTADLVGGPMPDDMPEDDGSLRRSGPEYMADKLGVPKREASGALSRTVGAGLTAAPAGALFGPEAILPTMASGAASQLTAEAGGGPLAQTAAGLLTPLTPTLAAGAFRGAVRGGAESGRLMQASQADAEAAGLKSSVGSTSGNPIIRSYEAVASKLPGGKALAEVRDPNPQVEESVSNIIKKIDPTYDQEPITPSKAGQEVKKGAKETLQRLNDETSAAKTEMDEAVGGKDHPVSAPILDKELQAVLHPTGDPAIDAAVTGAKTRAAAGTIAKVTKEPAAPKSYTTDGEGYHTVKSENGETHAIEQANGDFKVVRSDTSSEAQGKGEGTGRLELLAHAATSKGKSLVSDISVSPAEATAYEKLGRRGWKVERNPNAEVNPDTGNAISDSPKSPVYKVTAPESKPVSGAPNAGTSEKQFGGQWTYDPKTGKTEPVTSQSENMGPSKQNEAELGEKTPWTFDSLRTMRTNIGQQIGRAVGTQKAQLQRLYGAMSEDLKNFVESKGTEAQHKYEFFNATATENGTQRKALTKAIKEAGGTGEIFTRAMSGSATDAGKLSRVLGAMDEPGKNTFRAVVLHRMGRVSGAQTGPFSADTFLKNWDKMSLEAKNVLFGEGKTANIRKSLDSLSTALTDMKAGGQLRSNFTQQIAAAGHGIGKGAGLLGAVLFLKEFGEPMYHLANGHHLAAVGAAATGLSALTINPVMSRVLTNPKVINWLARSTKLPPAGVPAAMLSLNQLAKQDPDAKALQDLLSPDNGKPGDGTKQNIPPQQIAGADESKFKNTHKISTIHTPAGDIQGVDPSTF